MVSMATESEGHTIWAPWISSLVCVCVCVCVWEGGIWLRVLRKGIDSSTYEDYICMHVVRKHVVRKQDSVQLKYNFTRGA